MNYSQESCKQEVSRFQVFPSERRWFLLPDQRKLFRLRRIEDLFDIASRWLIASKIHLRRKSSEEAFLMFFQPYFCANTQGEWVNTNGSCQSDMTDDCLIELWRLYTEGLVRRPNSSPIISTELALRWTWMVKTKETIMTWKMMWCDVISVQVTETRTGPLGCSNYDNLDTVSSVLVHSPENKVQLQGKCKVWQKKEKKKEDARAGW